MPAPIMQLLPNLPNDAQADVRFHCGFGCVRCGVTIYRYLALPAVTSMPQQIGHLLENPTLLCPPCHDLVETGRLTAEQVHSFHASPIARQPHFDHDHMPFSNELPELVVGGSHPVRDMPVPIALFEEPLLLFAPPLQGVGATRISVRLGDANGEPQQIVHANAWLPTDGSWTFAQRGDRYAIESAHGDGLVILRFEKRDRIIIEHLRTRMRGRRVEATPDWVEVDSIRLINRIPSHSLIGLEL